MDAPNPPCPVWDKTIIDPKMLTGMNKFYPHGNLQMRLKKIAIFIMIKMKLDPNDSKSTTTKEGERSEMWTLEKLNTIEINTSSKRKIKSTSVKNIEDTENDTENVDDLLDNNDESKNDTIEGKIDTIEGKIDSNYNENNTPKILNNSNSCTNDEKYLTPGWIKSALKGESLNTEGKLQFLGYKIIEGDYFFKFSDSINSMYNFVTNGSKLTNFMRKLKKFSEVTVKKVTERGFPSYLKI